MLSITGNHDNSLTMIKSLAESISFPIILPDMSTSARLKREEIHRSQSRRALHRSFGVTSKVFRRDHGQRNDSSERPLKRTADGHLTTKKKIPRTFAAAGTETKLNSTTTTTAFPLSH
ncbi:hypothetical protein GCK32_019318 [Trichostrongylus colubriformis]|uniref:Uncharacterized protein n=1 Tax=Trichostrongylus colubriformis TaxID=6319 RepID=A0AAN8IJU3_TRICO